MIPLNWNDLRFLLGRPPVVEEGSAAVAARRMRYILAMDRTLLDGRKRLATIYRQPGLRMIFDEPLAILPDETLSLDYEARPEGLRGFATIQRTFPADPREDAFARAAVAAGACPACGEDGPCGCGGYGKPPHRCQFCGAPSWREPSEQTPPQDYCHPEDHGSPDDDE